MSLMNRRSEYSWGKTLITDLKLIPESREYKLDEAIRVNLGLQGNRRPARVVHP